jgi:nitrate reductase assembly molybdenum cofactor insertion protein NarJ
MSDKWDELAFGLFAGKSGMVDEPGMLEAAAQALRDAEKAGMERAAVRIAELEKALDDAIVLFARASARAIRAAKETNG